MTIQRREPPRDSTAIAPTSPTERSPVVEVEHLSKSFGHVRAADDVSFTLHAGEVVALAGENGAGKSTIKNILSGVVRPDAGTIRIHGEEFSGGTRAARRLGVAAVHQELTPFPDLTVAENILITDLGARAGFVYRARLGRKVRPLLQRVNADFGPWERVERLSTARRQLVEIAKALAQDPSIVIFDEPTASLTPAQRECVYAVVRQLAGEGAAVLYISHHLEEIFELSHRVIVLRDGHLVADVHTAELSPGRLQTLMVGRELARGLPRPGEPGGDEVLMVEDLSDGGQIAGVSLAIRRGEIFGLAGLMGSGRTEVAQALFGLSHAHGSIEIEGKRIRHPSPRRAIAAGVGFITEDRRAEGLFLNRPIRENLSVLALDDIARGHPRRLNLRAERKLVSSLAHSLRIAARGGLDAPSRSLSGGNQQKVVIGKWLSVAPRLLVVDEPTRGIDVGAKVEIYRLIVDLAGRGAAVLFISSEMNELIGLCHRVGVMHKGRLAGVLERAEATPEHIIRLATGGAP